MNFLTVSTAAVLGCLLLGGAFFLPADSSAPFKAPSEFWIVTLAWAAISLMLPQLLSRSLDGWRSNWLNRIALVLLVWLGVTSALAFAPQAAWAYSAVIVTYVLFSLLLASWLRGRSRMVLYVWGLLGLLVSIQGLIAWAELAKVPFLSWAASPESPSFTLVDGFLLAVGAAANRGLPTGTLGNVNYLAELIVLVVPVVLAFCWSTGQRAFRMAGVVLAAGTLPLLYVADARAAMAALVLVLPVAWLAAFVGRKGQAIAGSVVGAGAAAAIGLFGFVLASGSVPNDLALAARVVNWRAAWSVWLAHPLQGVGVGGFKLVNLPVLQGLSIPSDLRDAVNQRLVQLHNEPFQLLIELGLVGLVLVAALAISWVVAVARNPSLTPWQRFGLWWGMGAVAVTACFGFPLHIPLTALAVAVVASLGLADVSPATDAPPASAFLTNRLAVGGTLGAVVIGGIIVSQVAWPEYRAHNLEYQAIRQAKQRDLKGALALFQEADQQMRFRGRIRWHELRLLVVLGKNRQALELFQASQKEGLGIDCYYWEGRALEGLYKPKQALAAYSKMTDFYAEDSALYRSALQRQSEVRARFSKIPK
jgi:O-antigen ligase